MDVHLRGKRVRLAPSASIGKGGEADVFDLGDGVAAKVWKAPEHPDYEGQPDEQAAARARIAARQRKLREFPKGLPARVVAPREPLTDPSGAALVGYTMELVTGAELLMRWTDAAFCQGRPAGAAVPALRDLHRTVEELHARGVVIGDFNDLNVLVRGSEALLIDADSLQFGPFLCQVFTERFVDPTRCDPSLSHLLLAKPHSPDSDWYAFTVMVMQSLLRVGPYGGVFKPKAPSAKVPQAARPLRRITVFHPEVQYPRPAIPPHVLPDELLHHFHLVFERDERGPFPRRLLDALAFGRCATCGAEHARPSCPACRATAPAALREVTIARGEVTATRLFEARGALVAVTVEDGALRWLAHEDGRFVREDGEVVLEGDHDPSLAFVLHGRSTLVLRGGVAIALAKGAAPERFSVDRAGAIAANSKARYWAQGGRLLRKRSGAAPTLSREPETTHLGDVLAGQTRLWVGERFGLGFYRAGTLSIAFVFDADRAGLDDSVRLPFPAGRLLDVACAIDDRRAFVLFAAQQGGRTIHRCVAVNARGAIEAIAEAEAGDGSWLGALHGRCAHAGFLLAPTDAGVVRVEVNGGALVIARSFPDTEPFVNEASRLFVTSRGLVAADARRLTLLKIH